MSWLHEEVHKGMAFQHLLKLLVDLHKFLEPLANGDDDASLEANDLQLRIKNYTRNPR